MNDETMALIDRLGATSDSTAEPGHAGTETPDDYVGTFPDYRDMPSFPYRPSRQDFRAETPAPLLNVLVIPVQTVPAEWATTPPVGGETSAQRFAGEPDYERSLDAASVVEIAGGVWDRNDPTRVLDVAIRCEGVLLATVGASGHREDLVDAAKGDGGHAFRLATPRHLKDGHPHRISAHVVGSDFSLNGSPAILEGVADPETGFVTLYLDHHHMVFGPLVDRLLADPTTTLLTLKVRSDFGSHSQRSVNVRSNIEHLLAHSLAGHLEFMTTSEFVQRVASGKLFGE